MRQHDITYLAQRVSMVAGGLDHSSFLHSSNISSSAVCDHNGPHLDSSLRWVWRDLVTFGTAVYARPVQHVLMF